MFRNDIRIQLPVKNVGILIRKMNKMFIPDPYTEHCCGKGPTKGHTLAADEPRTVAGSGPETEEVSLRTVSEIRMSYAMIHYRS